MIFCLHTSLKKCSNAHLLYINSASVRFFALSVNKISIHEMPFGKTKGM